jgi:hypothetical protein
MFFNCKRFGNMKGTIYGNRLPWGTQIKSNVGNHWFGQMKPTNCNRLSVGSNDETFVGSSAGNFHFEGFCGSFEDQN